MQYGTPTLRVPAVFQLQTDDDAAAPAPTTIVEPMECLDNVPGISRMPQGTYRTECSHNKRGSGKPKSNKSISGYVPAAMPDSSLIQNAKPVELVSVYLSILPPQQITI